MPGATTSDPEGDPRTWPARVLVPERMIEAPGGPPIACYDLGGQGPDLLMVHATGFCAAVLAPLAAWLAGSFRCLAIDQRAHGASGRPDDGDFAWSTFAADVLAVVDGLGLDHPVAFGHSSGGAALLLAEETRPGTFAGLYCFEPIVFPGDAPLPPNMADNPLATGARRRRRHFAGREEALANFSAKAPFDRLDPAALAAYVDNGFEPDPAGGIRLRCRREDEAQFYAGSLSHDAYARLHLVDCPVTLACGEHTDAIGRSFLERFAARLSDAEVVVLPGLGHFGPLEDPAALAASVTESRAVEGRHSSSPLGEGHPPGVTTPQ